MFDNLSDRLSGALKKLKGEARLTEENIQDTLKDVRMALLEADVALPVVKEFIDNLKQRVLGKEVQSSLTPGQAFLKVVQAELQAVMGEANEQLNLSTQPPAIVLMAGLQGVGKTTTVAKLAHFLKQTQRKKVMVVSADVYRPAAIDQLQTLATEVDVEFYPSDPSQSPIDIANNALAEARKRYIDVLIVDTAGRLHVDETMMTEIKQLHQAIDPIETLFVVDSMAGQDAVNTAKAFHDALPLTGVVLTKADGDARGGAALSIRHVTGKPIKFIGVGEKTDALEPFHPDRIASRILGMGDVLSLIEEVERTADKKKTEKLARKINKGKAFNMQDLKSQLEQMIKMGGMSAMIEKLPGAKSMPPHMRNKVNDKVIIHQMALIDSMTPKERRFPDLINGSRKKRIAQGAGLQIQDVNRLLKQHKQMAKMMKKFKRGNLANMMRGMHGGMPPM